MKRFLSFLATGALALGLTTSASAQITRGVGAGGLILDDYHGHLVSITAPTFDPSAPVFPPTSEWMAWEENGFPNLQWSVPVPPAGNPQAGFLYAGPFSQTGAFPPSPFQLSYWIGPGQTGFNGLTGGSAGAWGYATTTQLGLLTAGLPLTPYAVTTADVTGDHIVTPAGVGTATTVLHGNGTPGYPSWGAVVLTTDVSGTLPIGNGGTNATSFSGANQFVETNGANTALVSAALSTNATLTGSGIASQLAINLTNPNTWTGVQTFPAGSITNVELAHSTIGLTSSDASLTVPATLTLGDAADNLKINLANPNTWTGVQTFPAGSITNVELANSTMNFTSTGTTLTASGVVALGGSPNYDLNLGHPNTWTGVQTFPAGSITNVELANSTMNFTSTGTTLTASGVVALGGSPNYDLNLAHSNTWTADQTFSGAGTGLSVTTNATVTGTLGAGATTVASLNATGGGITNAGAISGATGITSSGTITFSGLTAQPGVVHNSALGVLSSSGIVVADITPGGNNTFLNTSNGGVVGWNALNVGASLQGNGSSGGTALAINVGNSNTWTADQTFSGAGTGLAVTTNATVTGTLGAGATTVASLNASSGGITNAGAISGATAITSSGTIIFSGLGNGVVHATGGTGTLASSLIVNADLTSTTYSNITGIGAQSQALNMNSHLIDNVTDPVAAQDAATMHYVTTSIDAAVSGTTNSLAIFTGANAVGNSGITESGGAIQSNDAIHLGDATHQGIVVLYNAGGSNVTIAPNGSNVLDVNSSFQADNNINASTGDIETAGTTRIDNLGNFFGDGASITNLNGSNISSGTVALNYGGTGADYSNVGENQVFASPDGASGAPVFRALVNNDLPGTGVIDFTSSDNTLNSPGSVALGGTADYTLNLGNANTWTATQTFPVGSITNGELANSTIGTQSSDGSLTVANPLTLGDASDDFTLNLGNANTWTATQTFPAGSITNGELANSTIGTQSSDGSLTVANPLTLGDASDNFVLNLTHSNTWTADQTFSGAGTGLSVTTNASVTGTLGAGATTVASLNASSGGITNAGAISGATTYAGTGNIVTTAGALASGNNANLGLVSLGDGSSANRGTIRLQAGGIGAAQTYLLQTVSGGTLAFVTDITGDLRAGSFTSLNANGGGITNAGAISGGTGITSSGTIIFSALGNGVVHATGGLGTLASSLIVNGDLTSTTYSNITGIGAQSQALNMNSHQINLVSNPTLATDAANLGTVTAAVNAAVSGTIGNLAVFTGANAVGSGNLSGDVTTTGSTLTTLATVNGNVGSWGTATSVGNFTVNGKGLITVAGNTPITGLAAGTTNLTTGHIFVGAAGVAADVAMSGDAGIATGGALTLATVNGNVGGWGTATSVGNFTVNAKGLVTAAGNTPITGLAAGTSALTANHIYVGTAGNVTGDVAMSGDASIVTSGALTLATVNGNVGGWGTATSVGNFTVNAKGLVTAAGNTPITGLAAGTTNLTTGHIFVGAAGVAADVAMSGDAGIATGGALTLATVNGNVGGWGTATSVGNFTVNAKGLVTAAGNTPITGLAAGTSALTANHIYVGTAGNVTGDVAMSGDASIVTSGALTLATVNGNVGGWGTATSVGNFTVNAKGLVTAAGNTPITGLAAGTTNLTTGHIFVGAAGVAADVAMSGDAGIATGGALTLATVNGNVGGWGTATSVGNFTVNAKGLVTAAGNTPITGLGTGTVNLTSNDLMYGSAGVGAALASANNGTLVTSNTGVPSILAGPGVTGDVLISNAAAAPSWSTGAGIFVQIAPATAQTIQPTVDATPLTIHELPAGQVSDLFDIDGPTGTDLIGVSPAGNLGVKVGNIGVGLGTLGVGGMTGFSVQHNGQVQTGSTITTGAFAGSAAGEILIGDGEATPKFAEIISGAAMAATPQVFTLENVGGTLATTNDITGDVLAGSFTSVNGNAGGVTTSGNISTTGSGTITSAGALTVSSGGAGVTGGIASTVSGTTTGLTITNTGTGNDISGTALAVTQTGHVTTSSTIGAGVGDGTIITTGSISESGSDVAGNVTFSTTGAGLGTATISFANSYTTAPTVIIYPANQAATNAGLGQIWITEDAGGASFTINCNAAAAVATAEFNYIVVH